MAKSDYLTELKRAVEHMHGCQADHFATVTVHEVFRGQTVWKGDVEVFTLKNHPKAKRCFAWSHESGKDDRQFVAVLEIPPVVSAQTAVKASIVSDSKKLTR